MEWRRLLRLAGACWLDVALAWRFREHGLTAALPAVVREYLEGAEELGRLRAEEQMRQAGRIIAALNEAGLRPLVLKGTAAHLTGLYPPGARLCCDIDLLLPAGATEAAVDILRCHGYGEAAGSAAPVKPEAKHAPRLFHPDGMFGVELHRHLTQGLRAVLPADEALAAARPLPAGGPDALVLRSDHRIIHCIGHMIEDYWRGRQLSLRQFVELRELVHQAAAPLDWPDIAARFASARTSFQACLLLAERLVGLVPPPLPLDPAARLGAAANRWLFAAAPRASRAFAGMRGWMHEATRRRPAELLRRALTLRSPARKVAAMAQDLAVLADSLN